MKDRLNGYIQGLFADAERRAPDNLRLSELKEELLQNTYEKYDDLLSSGKTTEAAYKAAIHGIGDISELLEAMIREGRTYDPPALAAEGVSLSSETGERARSAETERIVEPDKTEKENDDDDEYDNDDDDRFDRDEADGEDTDGRPPRSGWFGLVNGIIWTVTILAYVGLSISTHAWSVTWVLFLMGIAAENVAKCVFDLRR